MWPLLFLFFVLVSRFIYYYFFDKQAPLLVLTGITVGASYAGDVNCSLLLNKKSKVTMWLDMVLIADKHLVPASDIHNFIIPTKTMGNGKHNLKVEAIDTTFAQNKTVVDYPFIVDNQPLNGVFIGFEEIHKVFQGRTIHVQIQFNKLVSSVVARFLSQTYDCFQESNHSMVYETFIPVQCEENPNEYLLTVEAVDAVGNTLTLETKIQIVLFPFKKHTLAVSEEKMKKEEELVESEKDLGLLLEDLTNRSPKQKLWKGVFCTPIDIVRTTCDFGTIRTTQRKGRYAHKAVDVINAPRSVVWAPQDGVVVVKERFLYSGNTIVIDHGYGILSLFGHLDDFAKINVGDAVKKGSPIGTLGKTGYASGYHLHWEMRVGNVPVDPMQWTKPNF